MSTEISGEVPLFFEFQPAD